MSHGARNQAFSYDPLDGKRNKPKLTLPKERIQGSLMLPVDRHETGPQGGIHSLLLGSSFLLLHGCLLCCLFLFGDAWLLVFELAK